MWILVDFVFYCFRRVEEDSVLDLASSSNRKLDIHSFSRLIESLNQDKASSHLVNQDVELFFAFLLGMIMYPNYAISNKTYWFVFQEQWWIEMEFGRVTNGRFWFTESRDVWMCCSIQRGRLFACLLFGVVGLLAILLPISIMWLFWMWELTNRRQNIRFNTSFSSTKRFIFPSFHAHFQLLDTKKTYLTNVTLLPLLPSLLLLAKYFPFSNSFIP